jgi:hypothetical protein
MASMRELAMELLSRSGSGPVLQPTNVYGQDPDLPIGYGEGEISPLDAAAMSTMFVPGVGDVTGLAADVDMYMRDPESRNIPNYLTDRCRCATVPACCVSGPQRDQGLPRLTLQL